jgi:hypothetical protein
MTDQAAGPSATKNDKNPKGGLSAAGRKKFGVKAGVKSYSSAGDSDKKRWVRWALRFTKTPRPLTQPNGEPTRYALMFSAWGEAVPKTAAAVRAVHAKAESRSKTLKMGKNADTAGDEGVGCSECEREFVADEALFAHLEAVHLELDTSSSDQVVHAENLEHSEMAATSYTCEFSDGRSFATQEALTAHLGSVHQKKPTEMASLGVHQCQPCVRSFTQERALFQHATAVHGYNEAEDRAKSGSFAKVSATYMLGTVPWLDGERRKIIESDRETGVRVIKDYETLYKASDDSASYQVQPHGSSSTVSGLSCSACDRAFLSVRGLRDHAEAVHQDEALEATYDERRELVQAALRTALNPAASPMLSYQRTVYCWISDMTDDFCIYQVEGEEHHRKATYSIADDGVVTLGEGVHVRRRAVYETVGSE